ncbi:hypothetical protein [Flavobacterium sp.]|uniref:hypothetical protein n=1 Tax=Flavobacterium sp. TaxID=239 RepID=UPI0026138315|nr:hypothetical protein [Flavobacterium sp.]
MGQAKNRGTLDERVAAAKAMIDALRPASITCNECKADVTDIHNMDTRGMPGIHAVFAGICSCGATTYAMQGEKDALEKFLVAMEASH